MAAIRESGIVSRLIRATRHSKRKPATMATTSRKPMTRAWVRLWMARSMKLACWKTLVSKVMLGRPGWRSRMACSTPLVISRVLPHGSF